MLSKKRYQNGVVTVEFAIGSIFFFAIIYTWVEICFMSYVSAVGDYAVAEAVRITKANLRRESGGAGYKTQLDLALKNVVFGDYFKDGFTVDVQYLKKSNLSKLSQQNCDYTSDGKGTTCDITGNTDGTENPIAVYQINFDYEPLLSAWFMENGKTIFSREVIAIQEYERCSYNVSGKLTCP